MSLSTSQERALAITPKFTASLSIPCSLFLIYEIYCDHVKNPRKVNAIHRTLVGMSCIDVLSSTAWFLSTWAVPAGSFALAAGNRASCTFQGFLLQLAIGPPLYNSSLALFYLLVIKYRWTDEMLARVERWVHFFVLSFAIGTSILLLPLDQYNHIGAVCWVIGDPQECGHSSFQTSNVPCERGNHAYIYGMVLFYGPLWICVLCCVISMFVIHREVQITLRRLHRYSINGRVTHALGRSQADPSRVASQAILYSLSFLITWMPSTLWSIAHWFNWKTFWLDYIAAVCEPTQGLLNFLVFARNRKCTRRKLRRLIRRIMPLSLLMSEAEETSDDVAAVRSSRASAVQASSRWHSSEFSVNGGTNWWRKHSGGGSTDAFTKSIHKQDLEMAVVGESFEDPTGMLGGVDDAAGAAVDGRATTRAAIAAAAAACAADLSLEESTSVNVDGGDSKFIYRDAGANDNVKIDRGDDEVSPALHPEQPSAASNNSSLLVKVDDKDNETGAVGIVVAPQVGVPLGDESRPVVPPSPQESLEPSLSEEVVTADPIADEQQERRLETHDEAGDPERGSTDVSPADDSPLAAPPSLRETQDISESSLSVSQGEEEDLVADPIELPNDDKAIEYGSRRDPSCHSSQHSVHSLYFM